MQDTIQWTKSDYINLALWFIPAAIVTWGIHEVTHWATGELLGYEMWITFNQAGPVIGSYESTFDNIIVAISGPVITLIQAIVALALIKRLSQPRIYSFLFMAFYIRFIAMGISFVSHPNDEAAVSILMGLPMWVIPTIFVTILFVLTFIGSKQLGVGWKGNLVSYVMASIMALSLIHI